MLKLMTIIGTRPDIIKLSQIIKQCDRCFEHILVHTGQNYDYELNRVFFEDLKIREPNFYLDTADSDLGVMMGSIISASYALMKETAPDAVLILGDTNSALSVISAKRLKIPIFHLEAGNRCFDENLPEEVNRRIVDHTSDVNLCYTEHARRYLHAEGIRKEFTFVVGSPMAEVLRANKAGIAASAVLERLRLEPGGYILLSAHREENIDIVKNFFSLMNAVNKLAETLDMPVIYSIHPRSAKHIKDRGFTFHENVRKEKPLGFLDYICLQKNAYCVVSDSGTLAEESSILKFPAVSIRTSTERPEALDRGNFVIGGIDGDGLLGAVKLAAELRETPGVDVPDYADENVSAKVARIVQGYTGIVNTVIWRK